ncbi:TPA: metal ABC transporter permease [bacterium]|nr:metal ABC transporter permease [bacterium]
MLGYELIRRAFLVGIFLALSLPLIGVPLVLRRLSSTGDALSHVSLSGVAIGLLLGIDPIIGAIGACIIASFSIEGIRKRFHRYSDIAVAIIMSAGIGLASILSGLVKNVNFESFLFGSILTISKNELYIVITIFILVVLFYLLFYKELMYITFNETQARISKVPINLVNFIYLIISALTIAVSSKIIGALIVSSLMVLPTACSLLFGKNYKQTIIYASLFALFFMISGIVISYYQGLKTSGTVVLIGVISLIISLIIKYLISNLKQKNLHH